MPSFSSSARRAPTPDARPALQIEWNGDHHVTHFRGVLTADLLLEANDRWVAESAFDGIDYYVIDLLGVTRVEITPKGLRKSAIYNGAASLWLKRSVRAAIVVPDEAVEQKVKAYLQHVRRGPVRRIFYDMDEAMSWASALQVGGSKDQ